MTKLNQLRNSREKLIQLNNTHHYTQIGNPKIKKYYQILLSIRKAINEIECVNVRPANAKVGMTAKDLRMLIGRYN